MEKIKQALRQLLIAVPLALIKFYQWFISPMLGQRCRFHPSCSQYGFETIKKRGLIIGLPKTLWRIVKCNPWNKGGVDLP